MKYRQFIIDSLQYIEESKEYVGSAKNKEDNIVTFEAPSIRKALLEFKTSVDDYYIWKDARIQVTPLELAKMFHTIYEMLAPNFGYETRKETKVFDENSNNGKLMVATCAAILDKLNENIR